MDGVKETVDIEYTKQHYYGSHPSVNPRGIVPKGPLIDYEKPHGREGVGKQADEQKEEAAADADGGNEEVAADDGAADQ